MFSKLKLAGKSNLPAYQTGDSHSRMDAITPLVKKQYTEWPYPQPITNIATWRAMGGHLQCNLKLDHNLIWPERDHNPEMSILIAGCGTMEAAVEAYNNPKATVVGIDLSPTSLEYTNQLKKQHGLKNLELRQMDLHDVASLGRQFDLVISFGVLHHLPDPQKGLMALAEVTKDDGVLFATLYGTYLRHGVYMVQEALQRLEVGQTPADVAFVRQLITSLPPSHPLHAYMRTVNDLNYDAGIVDTFLNKQDRAFSVPDILSLAASCDLKFQGWFDNLFYYPDGMMLVDQPLYQKVSALPDEKQWPIVELLVPPVSGHRFLLRKNTSDPEKYRINFKDSSFLNMIPARRHLLKTKETQSGTITITREWHGMEISGLECEMFAAVDGSASIEAIIQKSSPNNPTAYETARDFFSLMWRLGHLTMAKGR